MWFPPCIPWKIHRILLYIEEITIYNNFHNVLHLYLVHFIAQDIMKLFSLFQVFYECSMKVTSASSCAGSHHITQFGSWSGAAKVVHPKVVEQPRRTFFASSFTTATTIASASTNADRNEHVRTHTRIRTCTRTRTHSNNRICKHKCR